MDDKKLLKKIKELEKRIAVLENTRPVSIPVSYPYIPVAPVYPGPSTPYCSGGNCG